MREDVEVFPMVMGVPVVTPSLPFTANPFFVQDTSGGVVRPFTWLTTHTISVFCPAAMVASDGGDIDTRGSEASVGVGMMR